MAVGQLLKLRLFLEGVEVPVVSADIQSQPGQAAMASIQIPANDFALDLKPRTLVHLYCYDFYEGAPSDRVSVHNQGLVVRESPGADINELRIHDPDRFENTQELSETDLENQKYKLIFGGEVLGISFQKTPTSRAVVLQCLDWSNYWDIAFQYMVSGFSLGRGGMKAVFSNYNTQLFRDFFKGSADIITELIMTPPRSYPNLKGTLLGGLMHLIEAIGGTYFGDKAVVGANDFFSLAELRLHLTQMVGANPFHSKDEARLLTARGFAGLFRRNLSGLGKEVSIRSVLQALERYIFHQIVPITSPRFIPAQVDPNVPNFELIPITHDKVSKPIVVFAKALQKKVQGLIDRIEMNTGEDSVSGELSRELQALVRQARNAAHKAREIGRQDNAGEAGDFLGLPDAARAFDASANILESIMADAHVDMLPTGGSPGARALVNRLATIRDEHMPTVLRAQRRARLKRSLRQPNPPPRLLQQIYRPDVWMVAPPRCNVLFPELYTGFSYGRDFQQEITRLMLRTHDAFFGSDILFDGFYFAPSKLRGARTNKKHRAKEPDVNAYPAHIIKDLMDHELYTGVIPAFERMSDLNLHVLRGGGHIEIEGTKVGYAQLAANHIFFQYRFRSRQLNLQAKFNPFLVLGFPALVIDKYVYYDENIRRGELGERVIRELADQQMQGEGIWVPGTSDAKKEAAAARADDLMAKLREGREQSHFLGTPIMISHTISAESGGSTSVQMGYARTSNEKTEFLGDNVVSKRTAKKVSERQIRHRVACLEEPKVGMVGPRGGKIVDVRDITGTVQRDRHYYVGAADESGYQKYDQLRSLGLGGAKDARFGYEETYRYYDGSNARLTNKRSAVTGQRMLRGTELPLFIPNHRLTGRTRDRAYKVLVGVEQPVSHYGPAVVALLGTAGEYQFTGEQANSLLLIRAYEIVENVGVYRKDTLDLPPEDLCFPPWYGEKYRARQIGGLYSYFFGTGSLVDPIAVGRKQTPPGADYLAPIESEDDPELTRAEDMEDLGSGRNPVQEGEYIGSPSGEFGEVSSGADIAEAIESVVDIYSRVKSAGQDVNEFIRGYTWRPIANIVDILGTADLEIDEDGNVLRGIEGFHSRAFGDVDDLRNLVSKDRVSGRRRILGLYDEQETMKVKRKVKVNSRAEKELQEIEDSSLILHWDPDELRASTTDAYKEKTVEVPNPRYAQTRAAAARLDTRKEKREQVLKYLHALLASRGILG